MPVPTFKQYVLPPLPKQVDGVNGYYDVRISRGYAYDWNHVDIAPTEVLFLDRSTRMIKTWSSTKKSLSDQDGDLVVDAKNITLFDLISYKGVDGAGTAYAEDLSGAKQSILWKILLSDPSITTYKIWWSFHKSPTKGTYNGSSYSPGDLVSYLGRTYECVNGTSAAPVSGGASSADWKPAWDIFFGGDLDLEELQSLPITIAKPRTNDQYEIDNFTLKVHSFQERLKKGTVKDFTYSEVWSSSDMVTFSSDSHTSLTTRPFYHGFAMNTSGNWFGDHGILANIGSAIVNGFGIYDNENYDSTKFTYPGDNFPQRVWGVRPGHVIYRAANHLGFDFDDPVSGNSYKSADFSSAFTFYKQTWNNTRKSYDITAVDLSDIALCFNTLFGVRTVADTSIKLWGTEMPTAFSQDTSISDLLKAFAYQFGTNISFVFDAVTGRPRLKMLSRRSNRLRTAENTDGVANGTTTFTSSGSVPFTVDMVGQRILIETKGIYKVTAFTSSTSITLDGSPSSGTNLSWHVGGLVPAHWIFQKGFPKRESIIVSKDFVSVKQKAADGEWRVPANRVSTNSIAIEIPWRVQPMGAIGVTSPGGVSDYITWPQILIGNVQCTPNMILNSKVDILNGGQRLCAQITSNGCTSFEAGAYLFYIKTTDTNDTYPPAYDNAALWANGTSTSTTHWSGFTRIAAMSEKPSMMIGTSNDGGGSIASTRCDALAAAGQLYVNELLGTKQCYSVKYKGCSDGNGILSNIDLNILDAWPVVGGDFTTFRGIDIEIDELKLTCSVKFYEKPATYDTLPERGGCLIDNNSTGTTSMSAGGSGSSLGNQAGRSDFIWQAPATQQAATITPTIDQIGLITNLGSGYSSHQQEWQVNGSPVAYMSKDGDLTLRRAYCGTTVSGDTSDALITKSWAVTLTPDNSNVNIIEAQDALVGPMVLKQHGTSTQKLLDLRDGSNNPLSWFTSIGALQIAASFAASAISLNANTTLSASHLAVDVDTTSGNKTITLPAHGTCIGRVYIVRKAAAGSTLTVAESGGGNIKLWTASGEMHLFVAYPNGWGVM